MPKEILFAISACKIVVYDMIDLRERGAICQSDRWQKGRANRNDRGRRTKSED